MEAMIDIGGTPRRMRSDDEYLESLGADFEPHTVRLLSALARGIALDVGANIGCTALALSQLCDQVHAFEPSPSTFHLLAENIRQAANVTAHNLGLSDKRRRAELTFSPKNRSGGYISGTRANGYHVHESVALDTLDRTMKKLHIQRVDFVKIDVEGFEGHVIRGAKRMLRNFRPVVVMELNHWCLNAFQRVSVPDFLDQMAETFPILYAVDDVYYGDIHDSDDRYVIMHRHITRGDFQYLVGAFDPLRLDAFRALYARKVG